MHTAKKLTKKQREENRREAQQIRQYELEGDPKEGRSDGWVPDAYFSDGAPIELKTGQRTRCKDGSWGAGEISTTRNYNIGCFSSEAYASDVHWVLAFYDKENNEELYEHWYCAPGWLDEWQHKKKDTLLHGPSTRLHDLLNAVGDDSELREVLIKQIHHNNPKITRTTYIEKNPLCVRFDGTAAGLLEAREKLS